MVGLPARERKSGDGRIRNGDAVLTKTGDSEADIAKNGDPAGEIGRLGKLRANQTIAKSWQWQVWRKLACRLPLVTPREESNMRKGDAVLAMVLLMAAAAFQGSERRLLTSAGASVVGRSGVRADVGATFGDDRRIISAGLAIRF